MQALLATWPCNATMKKREQTMHRLFRLAAVGTLLVIALMANFAAQDVYSRAEMGQGD